MSDVLGLTEKEHAALMAAAAMLPIIFNGGDPTLSDGEAGAYIQAIFAIMPPFSENLNLVFTHDELHDLANKVKVGVQTSLPDLAAALRPTPDANRRLAGEVDFSA